MTSGEIKMIQALDDCTFPPGTSAKRFVQNLASLARMKSYVPLSVKQWYFLVSLYHSCRGQIPEHDRDCPVCRALAGNQPLVMMVCPSCGYRVGMIQRMRDEARHSCPRCAGVAMGEFTMEKINE